MDIPSMKDVTKLVDRVVTTDKDREEIRTERLRIDTTSPFKLPHLIRPSVTIWAMAAMTVIILADIVGKDVSQTLTICVTGILGAAIKFYFDNRSNEKIAAKNAAANIELEKIRTTHEIKEERKDNRRGRKNN